MEFPKKTNHELNHQGIIPGPEETEEEYQQRAAYCLGLKDQLTTVLYKNIPLGEEAEADRETLKTAFHRTKDCYDIAPQWVPLFFSNYQLRFWQGGCVWIFQVSEDSPPAALIQLRQQLRHSLKYLWIYDREEFLAHELSHVGRLAFKEPKFEEFLAYRSSLSSFRKRFGPIVQSSFESILLVIVLILTLILDLSLITIGSEAIYPLAMGAKLIPFALIGAALIRLRIRHRQLQRCLENLETLLQSKTKANAVLYRLTDLEIIGFSKMTVSDVSTYILEQQKKSFRWRIIAECYFNASFG